MFLRTSLLAPDTRSSQLSARILARSVVPNFAAPSPVRGFLTSDLLRAAITALHDPLLVDAHKDAAALIGGLIALNPWDDISLDANQADSSGPRSIVLSLPGLAGKDERVDRAFEKITGRLRPSRETAAKQEGKEVRVQVPSERAQRAVVLDLLSGVRGVGIHEMGKVEGRSWLGSIGKEVRKRDGGGGLVERYSRMEVAPQDDDEFVGVAGMFGQ
jgi:exportin-5